jgi:hypothetical protein
MGSLDNETRATLPDLEEELQRAGEEANTVLREKQKAFIESLDLSK